MEICVSKPIHFPKKKRVGCFANHYNNQLFSINPGDNKTSRKTDCKKVSHLIATFVAGYDSSVNFMTDSHHHKNTEQGWMALESVLVSLLL